MSQTTAEILRAAAHRVRQGWCQGGYSDGQRLCAIGAVDYAAQGDDDVLCDALERLRTILGHVSIVQWNDSKGRTAEQVAQAMEHAAESLSPPPVVTWTPREAVKV